MAKPDITSTFGEKLKYSLIPGSLYIRYRARKEIRRGEAEVNLLSFLISRSRNAIDAGANKGVYTYFIAKYARHTYAYEPNPKMFAILQRNVGSRVTISSVALGDKTGQGVLRIPLLDKGHSNQGASLSAVKVPGNFTAVAVETARIDDLGLSDIGFIKIDVEGFEDAVLRGARQTIARDRPVLLVEIEEKHTRRPIEDDIKKITALGYDGMFLGAGGILHALSAFDPVAHHRQPTSGYVYNFIFVPIDRR
ncbi:MAG TPA: FkbM family methyltransferase [Stellaceae bacterium]|nr:FkbM family methyltransferase [Stellaceae bacterium]